MRINKPFDAKRKEVAVTKLYPVLNPNQHMTNIFFSQFYLLNNQRVSRSKRTLAAGSTWLDTSK